MKLNKLVFITFIILAFLMISAAGASDNQTADDLSENQSNIYVDVINGDDSNSGYDNSSSLKTITQAISIAKDNDTIYLAGGNYAGLANTRINLTKSLNFVGSNDVSIDGQNTNYLFIIQDNLSVSFKNITFANAYKSPNSYSVSYSNSVYGAALDIKNSKVLIDSCTFINNTLDYDDSVNEYIYGGAVSNFGDLRILNSYFEHNAALSTSGLFSYGGAVYNKGKLLMNRTVINDSYCVDWGFGAGIANDGIAVIDSSTIANCTTAQECYASALYNKGELLLIKSVIENNVVRRASFNIMFGAVYNAGNLTAWGNVFRNNSAYDSDPMPAYKGSSTIYNVGNLNLTYNAFIDNSRYEGLSQDVYFNGGEVISLDYNWWNTNNNPYEDLSRINIDVIESWLIFNLIPDYTKLDIGGSAEISAFWSSSSGVLPQIDLLPLFNVTFTPDNIIKELKGGETSFIFNHTQLKGSWTVAAAVASFTQSVTVDVGKIYTDIFISADSNITYGDDLNISIEVTGQDKSIVNGNVSVIIADNTYTVNLSNGKANLTISNLLPGEYNLKAVYNGNDDYFKAFNNMTVNIEKQDVNLTLTIPEVKIDNKGSAIVTLFTKGAQSQAILYIDGVRKKIVYIYTGNTTISLSNFGEGEYNITVAYQESQYYKAANVSGILKVKKYDSALNITAEDVSLGENVTLIINVVPDTLRGEATLVINNYNTTVYLDNQTTYVNLAGLEGGSYQARVIFKGDAKYYASNATTSFKVLKSNSTLTVDVNYDESTLNGTLTVKTTPDNCTGTVGVYINYKYYTMNLTNGVAEFNVRYDKGTNFIYVYYEGNDLYYESSWNTTIGVADEFVLIGKNVTAYQNNDFNYSVRLLEINGVPLPSRTITIHFNGVDYTVQTDNNGFAEFGLNLEKGVYNISATYKNSTVYNTLTVKDIKFNVTANNSTYGDLEIFKAVFDDGIAGKVNFIIDDALNVTAEIVNGTALFNVSTLNAGNYTLKAAYVTSSFCSDEITTNFEIKKADLAYDLIADDVTPDIDQIISLINLENATGSIIFNFNETTYKKDISNSKAILNLSKLEKGNYSIVIDYSGDNNYNSFTASAIFYVKDAYSDIVLKVSDANYGENIIATANLDLNATGSVRFTVNSLTYNAEIQGGCAKLNISDLNVGIYNITAEYLGNHYYISSSNSTTFSVFKANSTISLYVKEVYLNENIRIYADLSKNATGTVTFSMTGYYTPRDKPVTDSTSMWYISPLKTGSYTVIARYSGDDNYYASDTTYILNITQKKAILNVEIADAGLNDRVTAKINLTSGDGEKLNATISLNVNSKTYSITTKNGLSTFVIGKLPEGNYTYTASYEGDENYSKSTYEGKFTVSDDLLDVNLTVSDIEMYYKGSEKLTVLIKSSTGKVISGQTIIVTINNKNYQLTSDSEGKAYLDLDLKSGNYTAFVFFNQTDKYHSASVSSNVMIYPTVEGIDVVKLYGSGTQYFAIFCDSTGKVLSNVNVTFKIGTKSLTTTTLPNGISRLNINLSPGNYSITAKNPVTGEKTVNYIFVYNYLMGNKNINQYYGAKKVYTVRAYNASGQPVGAGVIVKIKLNGKTYKVKTNKNGYASKVINLKAGTYTIKAKYNGYTVSNKVKVKSLIIAKNLKVKKGKTIKYTVKLVNKKGKIVKGKKITFKFKGKTYKVKTNKKGKATLKLKLSLKVGKYKIKSVYGKNKVTKTITVKK